jgi:hypothetical protein
MHALVAETRLAFSAWPTFFSIEAPLSSARAAICRTCIPSKLPEGGASHALSSTRSIGGRWRSVPRGCTGKPTRPMPRR